MCLRSSIVIKSLFFTFICSSVSAKNIKLDDFDYYNIRLEALHRANINQTQPLSDPNGSFDYKSNTPVSKNNVVSVLKNIDKCVHPSKAFLLSRLLEVSIDFDSCPELSKYLEQTSNTSILFGYVSPNVKSPMSYFGHGFIVFSDNLSPFSRVISYSAIIPEKINYYDLIAKGAIGELQGRFVFSPLHLILDQYLSIEQRNVYFYEIKFNETENILLRLQSYEAFYATFRYHFFIQNCASELLQLMASIKPSLIDEIGKKSTTQPSQVIQLLKDKGLANDVILTKYSDLDNIFYANIELEEKNGHDKKDIKSYIESKKSNLYFKYFKKPLKKHMKYKSRLYQYDPVITGLDQKLVSEVPPRKIGIGYNEARDGNHILINYSPGLLDKNESRFSYMNETTLRVFDFSVAFSKNSVSLDKLDILELESFNKVSSEIVLPSWRFYIGYNQNYGEFESPNSLLEFAYGYSIGGLDYMLSILPEFSYNISDNAYAVRVNMVASLWSDIGNFSINYIPDLYESESELSKTIVFKYKTNFMHTSQANLVLSNHEYFTLGYSYRF